MKLAKRWIVKVTVLNPTDDTQPDRDPITQFEDTVTEKHGAAAIQKVLSADRFQSEEVDIRTVTVDRTTDEPN